MEAGPQIKYELVVQRKGGHAFYIISQKDLKLKKKYAFDILADFESCEKCEDFGT